MRFLLIAAALAAVATLPASAEDKQAVVRKHWFVSGKVQGVSFRAFTFDAARELKLKGWVRNLTDRRVEIVAEGDEKSVAALLAKVKTGPPSAKVEAVKEAKVDATDKLPPDFEIRDTSEPPKDDAH